MGLKIDRKQDKRVVHACTHMLADIPNGEPRMDFW